ncbi:MAG: tRNA uridine-5-carboxymethylaminomethyl(34) synthesis GTPase MnmE [Firmicutes bacterium]|nr:tRNA uridine-5-carboxymethylaminomethyl(34) synthesis GTPase MnmE [Bacillota bacterium]
MEDTIAAIATALGEGGIGIVRISGEESLPILKKIFIGKEIKNRVLTYGHIKETDTNQMIDEVMVVYMEKPHSYTTEDVVEIQCHGSIVSLRKILSLVLQSGARLAEPGEFTKRAFLGGRLDLSQAEAVIDLIRAKSDKTFDVALNQLEGKFSLEIKEIRSLLVDILVDITVNIDYPDEDIEEMTYEKLEKGLVQVKERIDRLLSTADTGRILKEGLSVAIIGKPNVGKSSLMNCLLRETRAIVTEIPGTTRDTIEEMVSIRNIPVKLVDTAGIRKTEDIIEKIGIEKSKDSFNKADLVIFVLDGSRDLEEEDEEILSVLMDKEAIVVINKSDLKQQISVEDLKKRLPKAKFIISSMKEGIGISEIEDDIEQRVFSGQVKQASSVMVTNVRHKHLLEQAESSVSDGLSMTKIHEPLEFIEIDINRCYEILGEIIGETASDDIINEVFARFCLGK